MRTRYTRKWFILESLGMALVVSSGSAQISLPPLKQSGAVVGADGQPVQLPSTPGHARFSVRRFADEQAARYSILDSLPKDSLQDVVANYAEGFVSKYSAVSGLQHQPYAVVAIGANEDPIGLEHFSAWLNTPNLPLPDVASALVAKVTANLDPKRPDRLAIAEQALSELEKLDTRYLPIVVKMHWQLIDAYYDRGDQQAMIAHGEQGLALAASPPKWRDRTEMLRFMPLLDLAQAYAGLPDGMARMEHVLKQYREAFEVTDAEQPTLKKWMLTSVVPRAQERADDLIFQVRQLGEPGSNLQAHAWLNAGVDERQTNPITRSVADGKIRVIEFGYMHCGSCMKALPKMQRLSEYYKTKNIEWLYFTFTVGAWDVDLMSPKAEVDKLRDLYVTRMGLTFPIGIWAGDKVENDDGGKSPVESVTNEAYSVVMTPEMVVLDGAGRIRFRSHSADERVLKRVVNFLLQEQSNSPDTPVLPPLKPVAYSSHVRQ